MGRVVTTGPAFYPRPSGSIPDRSTFSFSASLRVLDGALRGAVPRGVEQLFHYLVEGVRFTRLASAFQDGSH